MAEGCEVVTKLFSVVWMQEHVRIQGLLGRVLSRDHKGRTAGCGLRDRKCHFYPEVLRTPDFFDNGLVDRKCKHCRFFTIKGYGRSCWERASERASLGRNFWLLFVISCQVPSHLKFTTVSSVHPLALSENRGKTQDEGKPGKGIFCNNLFRY